MSNVSVQDKKTDNSVIVQDGEADATDHNKNDADTNVNATESSKKGKKSKQSLRPLMMLKPYLSRYRIMVVGTLVALSAAAIATLAVPVGVRNVIDMGFSGNNASSIDRYFLVLLAIGIVLAISSAARFFFVNWLGERLISDLRSDVFSHMTKLSPAFYDKSHSGEIMSRLTADTTQVKGAIGTSATQALRNAIMAIGSLVMMFFTSPWLSLLVLCSIPFIIIPLITYGRVVRKLSRVAQDTVATASAFASENLSSVRNLQAYTHEKAVSNRFRAEVEKSFEAAFDRMKARSGLTVIAISLVFTSIIAILWYGAHEVIAGRMSGGVLGQFVLYAAFAAGAFGGLSEVWGDLQQASGAAERLAELLNIKSDIESPENPKALPKSKKAQLSFKDVSFSYPSRPEDMALKDVSFTIKSGEKVAIVGASGSGKSTIFNLILRFYDPQKGAVLFDKVNIADADLEDLRNHMALVPQDMAIFADSILENIRYGKSDAPLASVVKAAEAAHASEFIDDLEEGYDTQIGERGAMLSGGQRQRISIARAILRDAPILLLDEATSALDAQSERYVQEALEGLMKNRTTLIIAHRLATIKKADRIFVMDKGQLAEIGSHEDLVKKGGIYARLAKLQFGEAVEA